MGIVTNAKEFYVKNKTNVIWVGSLIAFVLLYWFVFRPVLIPEENKERIKVLEERNKYLESENYKDSLYRVDTVNKIITLTNERIIYNTKIYEKIIHKYDSASAREHEAYYRTRYGKDTAGN